MSLICAKTCSPPGPVSASLTLCRFALWVCLHLRPPSSHGHAGEDHCQKRADRLPAGQNPTFRGDCGEAVSGEELNVPVVVEINHVKFRSYALCYNCMEVNIRNFLFLNALHEVGHSPHVDPNVFNQ